MKKFWIIIVLIVLSASALFTAWVTNGGRILTEGFLVSSTRESAELFVQRRTGLDVDCKLLDEDYLYEPLPRNLNDLGGDQVIFRSKWMCVRDDYWAVVTRVFPANTFGEYSGVDHTGKRLPIWT